MKRKIKMSGLSSSMNLTDIFLAIALDNFSHLFHQYRGNGRNS